MNVRFGFIAGTLAAVATCIGVGLLTPLPPSYGPTPSAWEAKGGPPQEQPARDFNNTEQGKSSAQSVTPPAPIGAATQTDQETASPPEKQEEESSHRWSSGDTIAGFAALFGLLQFTALVATVWVLVRTARRQLRAYISVEMKDMRNFAVPDSNLGFRLQIINHGQTPALAVKYKVALGIENYPLPPDFPWPESSLIDTGTSATVVHPDLPRDGRFTATQWSPEQIDTILTSTTQRMYIFGAVEYLDVFRKPKRTRFCVCLDNDANLRALANGANNIKLAWEHANQYNDTEQDRDMLDWL